MFCNKSFWIVIGKVALIFVLAAVCTIVAVLVINGLQQCKLFESIDSEGTILTFVGLLATFIVIVNYQQVQEAKDYIRNKQQEIDSLSIEVQNLKERVSDIEAILNEIDLDYRLIIKSDYERREEEANSIIEVILNSRCKPNTFTFWMKKHYSQPITKQISGFEIPTDKGFLDYVKLCVDNSDEKIDLKDIFKIKYGKTTTTFTKYINRMIIDNA